MNPVCTSYQEKLYHMKMFYNRKNGTTPEQFNRYWAYEHGKLTHPFHLRIGVIKYHQVRIRRPPQRSSSVIVALCFLAC